MDHWDDYRILIAVFEGKTLRAASRLLNQNHATLSRRIARINDTHPSLIIEQHAQGLRVTEYGQQMLATAHCIQHEIQTRERAYQHDTELAGAITFSVPPAILEFLLLPDITQYSAQHPAIKLHVDTGYSFANVNSNEADVVLRVADKPGDDLVGYRLFPVSLGFYAAQSYLESVSESEYAWITSSDTAFVQTMLKRSPYPNAPVNLTIDDLVLRHKAAADGYGLVIGAKYIAAAFKQLQPIVPEYISAQEMWLLTHKNLIETPRIKHFMQFILAALRDKKSLIV